MVSDLVNELDIAGQSSEDTNHDTTPFNPRLGHPFNVTVPYFRRRAIGEIMEELDNTIDHVRQKQAGEIGKWFEPKNRRLRKRVDTRSYRSIKKGLPRSMYHRKFLEGLTPNQLVQVDPRNEPFLQFSRHADQAESDSMEEI